VDVQRRAWNHWRGGGVPEGNEPQRGEGQVLLSRRQILTGTTVGIGATLLFHHAARNRAELPPARPARPPEERVAAGAAKRQKVATSSSGGGSGGAAIETAAHDGPPVDEVPPAIHRAQISDQGQPRAVAKSDSGVLVIGMSADGEPLGWLTDDGSQWVEHTFGASGRQTAEVWGVAPYVGDFIAVGCTREQVVRRIAESGIVPGPDTQVTFAERRRSPAVWRTSDCVRWSGQSFEDIAGPHAHLIAIASDEERLVAVGSTLDSDGAQGERGLVMTSTDGLSWQRVDMSADDELVEGSFTGVATGAGDWYATSTDIDGGAVWSSPDGLQWSVIDSSRAAFRGVTLQGVGIDGDRVLVAGTGLLDPEPRYFVSRTAGRTWRKAKLDVSLLAGPDAVIGDLAVISGDVVVVGTHRGAPVLEGGDLHVSN
jgi:hypothetical protein